jgi:FdhE protein
VAGAFLDRLFGRRGPLPPEVERALAELDKLSAERPSLAAPAAVLRDSLPALFAEPVPFPPPTLTADQAATKLAAGVPLLRGESLSVDKGFPARWQAVCAALSRKGNESAAPLAEALRHGKLNGDELLAEVLAGRPEAVQARAEGQGLDPGLAATVLRLTLLPLLAAADAALARLRSGVPWGAGHCPTCGSWPLLAELRGLDQSRYLRCGLCAAGWECARLLCPFCGTRDHTELGYFHAEGDEGRRRVTTCEACRGYVKTVTTLLPLSAPQLLVTDVATLPLDLAAAERGYSVPG